MLLITGFGGTDIFVVKLTFEISTCERAEIFKTENVSTWGGLELPTVGRYCHNEYFIIDGSRLNGASNYISKFKVIQTHTHKHTMNHVLIDKSRLLYVEN